MKDDKINTTKDANTLFESFQRVLHSFGMEGITHPLFYNSKIGLRFNIGDNGNDTFTAAYTAACFDRAMMIYNLLKTKPDLLVIDGYLCENEASDNFIVDVTSATGLPAPHEIVTEPVYEDDNVFVHIFLCWKTTDFAEHFTPDDIIKEIITSDSDTGNQFLSSAVYFVCTKDNVLFHLYDDRGADLLSEKKESIRHVYKELNHLVLDYDREKIDTIFKA